jgi:hypothetical protein
MNNPFEKLGFSKQKKVEKVVGFTPLSIDRAKAIAMANIELTHFINDILSFIDVEDDYFNVNNIYPLEHKALYGFAVNSYQYLVNYFTRLDVTYHLIEINEGGYKLKMLVETIPYSLKKDNVKVLKSFVAKSFSNNPAFYEFLIDIMASLNNLHKAIRKTTEIDPKPVIKVTGMNALYGQNKEGEPLYAEQLDELFYKQAQSILHKNFAVIDGETSLEVLNVTTSGITESINFLRAELARLFKIPQSKLFGLAPQGMNATGEYDDLQYQKVIDTVLNTVLIPACNYIDSKYTLKSPLYLTLIDGYMRTLDAINNSELSDNTHRALTKRMEEELLNLIAFGKAGQASLHHK